MTGATLVLTESVAALAALADGGLEAAAVLVVGVHRAAGRLRLLARELHPVADAHCDRLPDEMTVSSAGWVGAVGRAAELGAVALWVHTHPGGDPTPSRRDAIVDRQLEGPFTVRTGSEVYGSVVLSPSGTPAGFAFTGAGRDGRESFRVTRAFVVGAHLRLLQAHGTVPEAGDAGLYDRQVRAFGGGLQTALGGLRVGLAGAGGTGSAVAEQLARLGVADVTVFDPDVLSASNTTRVYGSAPTRSASRRSRSCPTTSPGSRRNATSQPFPGRSPRRGTPDSSQAATSCSAAPTTRPAGWSCHGSRPISSSP